MSHRPEHSQPDGAPERAIRKIIQIHVEPDLAADLRWAILSEGTTLQAMGEELLRSYVRDVQERLDAGPAAVPSQSPADRLMPPVNAIDARRPK